MNKRASVLTTAVAGLIALSPLQAHHSGSMYQTKPIWIEGTVARFEPTNPHTITTLEAPRADGRMQRWLVEGPPILRLNREANEMYVPQVGDVIRFCAFPYHPAEELQRRFPEGENFGRLAIQETDETVTQMVAGHVMLTPGGEKQHWEPHGVLAECIRSADDSRQSWLDFIDSDSQAGRAWCEQLRYAAIRQDAELAAYVEETNAVLEEPC